MERARRHSGSPRGLHPRSRNFILAGFRISKLSGSLRASKGGEY